MCYKYIYHVQTDYRHKHRQIETTQRRHNTENRDNKTRNTKEIMPHRRHVHHIIVIFIIMNSMAFSAVYCRGLALAKTRDHEHINTKKVHQNTW